MKQDVYSSMSAQGFSELGRSSFVKVALLSIEGGGIASVCNNLAYGLSKRKIETTIFSSTTDRKPKTEKINEHLEVVRLPLVDYPPRSIWYHLHNVGILLKLLKDYDIVHGVSAEMSIAYTFFRRYLKQPLITTLHMSDRGYLKAFFRAPIKYWNLSDFAYTVLELPLHEFITRRCFAKSNKVTVCSFTTLNELKTYERFDTSKVSVIYNGVNLNEIQQKAVESNDRNELSIMFAGRLFWMKGITFVLKAFENLKMRQFKNLHLKIFGEGPLKSEIDDFIIRTGLRNDVCYGGFLPHGKLIREIKNSDIVVFPSLYESQPMFVLETMACKKPLISFDLPYAREIIKNGWNGLLAKAYDVKDLSDKIALALQDEKLRLELSENAYEYVRRNHDCDTQAEKYFKLYKELIVSD